MTVLILSQPIIECIFPNNVNGRPKINPKDWSLVVVTSLTSLRFVNKKDKIMHSQSGKSIFSQFKKYLQEFIEKTQKRCSVVHTIVDYIKFK